MTSCHIKLPHIPTKDELDALVGSKSAPVDTLKTFRAIVDNMHSLDGAISKFIVMLQNMPSLSHWWKREISRWHQTKLKGQYLTRVKELTDPETKIVSVFLKNIILYPVVVDNRNGDIVVHTEKDPDLGPQLVELAKELSAALKVQSVPRDRVRADYCGVLMEKFVGCLHASYNNTLITTDSPLGLPAVEESTKLLVNKVLKPICVRELRSTLFEDGNYEAELPTEDAQAWTQKYLQFRQNQATHQVETVNLLDSQQHIPSKIFHKRVCTRDRPGRHGQRGENDIEDVKENIETSLGSFFNFYTSNIARTITLYQLMESIEEKAWTLVLLIESANAE